MYAVDHGSPQRTATTTIYVLVEGSQRPVFESDNYVFSVRDSTYWLIIAGYQNIESNRKVKIAAT